MAVAFRSLNSKSILVVPQRFVGDTVLSIPVLQNCREAFPEATLTCLVSSLTEKLLNNCPYLDACVIEPKGLLQRWQCFRGYDTVILLRPSFSFALFCKLAGVKTVLGFDKQRFGKTYRRWSLCVDIHAPHATLKTSIHQIQHLLSILQAAGIPVLHHIPTLWPAPSAIQQVETRLAAQIPLGLPIALLHVASASHGKTFPVETFVPAIQALHTAGYTLVTIGMPEDEAVYNQLALQSGALLHHWEGSTHLGELAALMTKASLFLGVDSGPMHMAAALEVPDIIAVFGPTNEHQWRPYQPASRVSVVHLDLECRPCYAKICEHNACRMTLLPALVLSQVQQHL